MIHLHIGIYVAADILYLYEHYNYVANWDKPEQTPHKLGSRYERCTSLMAACSVGYKTIIPQYTRTIS